MNQPLLRPAVSLFAVLSLVTGLAYPLATTGLAQLAMPAQAQGSLVFGEQGPPIGSTLIGQSFTDPHHFWGRPSATSPTPYNASLSGGANLGPLNPALVEAVKTRIQALRTADPGNSARVPADLVTTSASGLDPHISVAAARYQAARVARLRQRPLDQVQALIQQHSEGAWLGLLGEPRVNVLALNRALDGAP
ncbi:MAG: potassium-transporting ATPase subunit KdpC [Rubrivivax sp.]|nr:MAG: potassium-transporting ATPase subunit KdpC [Rubrivivax sp.]